VQQLEEAGGLGQARHAVAGVPGSAARLLAQGSEQDGNGIWLHNFAVHDYALWHSYLCCGEQRQAAAGRLEHSQPQHMVADV
jgi:hypothetical protein